MGKNKKIAIFGDSFSADWESFLSKANYKLAAGGWSYFLAQKYTVTNFSEMAVGEYKILKQVERADLANYDLAIVMHANPLRVHVAVPPSLYERSKAMPSELKYADLSKADLIYTHLINGMDLPDVKLAVDFIDHYVDLEYQSYVSNLFCLKIYDRLNSFKNLKHLHLADVMSKTKYEIPLVDIHHIMEKYNKIDHHNHISDEGNIALFSIVDQWIQENSQ